MKCWRAVETGAGGNPVESGCRVPRLECTSRFGYSCRAAQPDRVVRQADVAQLVAHHLAKVRVAGSNPVVRSEEVQAVTWVASAVGWPRGEATACKAVYTGSNPVPTSQHDRSRCSTRNGEGRLAQRESASLTRKRSLVQSQYRPPASPQVIAGIPTSIQSSTDDCRNPVNLPRRATATATCKHPRLHAPGPLRHASGGRNDGTCPTEPRH